MNWLAPDSKFMRAWSNLVDGVWINILMLVTSIPIITIGASTSALSYVTLKMVRGEDPYICRISGNHSVRILNKVH